MTAASPKALADLHGAAFRNDRPWTEREFRDLLSTPGVLLLETGQGFLMLRIVAGEAEILTLAVHPDARRTGRGTELVSQCLAKARQHGADRVFLEVAADNAPALALYARHGFVRIGQRKGYYQRNESTPVDALVLQNDLTAGHTKD